MKKLRFIEEKIFRIIMPLATSLILLSLVLIIYTIVTKGMASLSWSMITETPKGGFYMGKEGGVLNAIIGSILLACGAVLIAVIISIPIVLYMNVYQRGNTKMMNLVRLCFDVLWGIPSIVYGAFGFTIMLYFGMKTSLLAGIITVSLFILPVIIRTMDEVFKTVPKELLDASYSLGATKFETAFKVVIRYGFSGLMTAILIAFGRGIGDAASVLFTAGYSDSIPTSLNEPVATLPLAIFFQLGTPIPEVKGRAYASALILTIFIMVISIISRYITKRFNRYK